MEPEIQPEVEVEPKREEMEQKQENEDEENDTSSGEYPKECAVKYKVRSEIDGFVSDFYTKQKVEIKETNPKEKVVITDLDD